MKVIEAKGILNTEQYDMIDGSTYEIGGSWHYVHDVIASLEYEVHFYPKGSDSPHMMSQKFIEKSDNMIHKILVGKIYQTILQEVS